MKKLKTKVKPFLRILAVFSIFTLMLFACQQDDIIELNQSHTSAGHNESSDAIWF
jgi:hypothetical protein